MQTNPFATEAAEYAHLRPTYPDVLFGFLSTVVASRELAWTGLGGETAKSAVLPVRNVGHRVQGRS